MVNKEHMEQWIAALEAYDREPAKGMLRSVGPDGEIRMCALGIGINVMRPGCLETPERVVFSYVFFVWLGMGDRCIDIPLSPNGSGYDHVTYANDKGKQSPWTIAQRLRETYLKDES